MSSLCIYNKGCIYSDYIKHRINITVKSLSFALQIHIRSILYNLYINLHS